jgi:NAD(P)H-dependent flavin oxidoreductase YrpB (nitropropane dioxygenase family)
MGIAISSWPLARAVSRAGQLGVVSGTAIDTVFARRLQDHAFTNELDDVLARFPDQSVVSQVMDRFAKTKRKENAPYKNVPAPTHRNSQFSQDLLVLASFVEVALAKEGHDGIVGVNLLTKVQIPTLPTLYGAMLAGVDYVLMGAGVPTQIPGTLDSFTRAEAVEMSLDVTGATASDALLTLRFDPSRYLPAATLQKPKFIGIVSSHVLATALAKRSNGPVDGFVVERPSAGGHNAPPRGIVVLDKEGEPLYGKRDTIDFQVLRELDVPFWLGGGVTSSTNVIDAFSVGAAGVQVGTLFAYCDESGMVPSLRAQIVQGAKSATLKVHTSMQASSTGYPFKIAAVNGTISDEVVYEGRERKCDLGYLREAYLKDSGGIGYRCDAEPIDAYVKKGGHLEETEGSTCLCNGLMATCGLAQIRVDGRREPPIVTSGDCINEIRLVAKDKSGYSALDVITFLQPRESTDSSEPVAPDLV